VGDKVVGTGDRGNGDRGNEVQLKKLTGTGSDSRSSAVGFGEVVTATVATKPAFCTDVSVEKASVMAPELDVTALGNLSPVSELRSGELVEGPS